MRGRGGCEAGSRRRRAPSRCCCDALLATRARRFSTAAPPSSKNSWSRTTRLRGRPAGLRCRRTRLRRRRRHIIPAAVRGRVSSVGGVRLPSRRRWPHARRPLGWHRDGEPKVILVDGIGGADGRRARRQTPRRTQTAPRGCTRSRWRLHTSGRTKALEAAGAPLRRVLDPAPFSSKFRWRSFSRPTLVGSSRRARRRDRRAPRAAAARPASRRAGEDCGRRARSARSGAAAGLLGDKLGTPRPAMQGEGRVATVRHEKVGLSLTMAFLTSNSK